MCLLIALREKVPGWPLVVAANREERYDRPGEAPQVLWELPRVFGGRDPKAGGTWLAVNQWGMLCALTNRSRKEPPPGDVRSRGLLCLDAARQKSPIPVADMVARALARECYDGFNLFCCSPAGGRCFYYDGQLREKSLGSGLLVLTTGDLNDLTLERVRRAHDLLAAGGEDPIDNWLARLEAVCRDHGSDSGGRDSCCLHGETAGTVSSWILAFHENDPRQHVFRHCQGRPCETPFEPVVWPEHFFTADSIYHPPEVI